MKNALTVSLFLFTAGALAAPPPYARTGWTTNTSASAARAALGVADWVTNSDPSVVVSNASFSTLSNGIAINSNAVISAVYNRLDTRLPLNTLNRLNNGYGLKVLWIGDSLIQSGIQSIPYGYFQQRLQSLYGTNGAWGGLWHVTNGVYGALSGNGALASSTSRAWLEDMWTVNTSGYLRFWYDYPAAGYVTADRLGMVYYVTNATYTGTIKVSTISDGGVTNLIDSQSLSGSPRTWATNYSITSGNYQVLIQATGASVACGTPGLWLSTSTGVRYGILGTGGENNFDANSDWAAAVAEYQPDLLLVLDANDTNGMPNTVSLVNKVQTLLPLMDVVCVAMPPSVEDSTNSALNTATRLLWQNFARTNRNTTFYDMYGALGAGMGYSFLTNASSVGGKLYGDTIHPSSTNSTIANALGRELLGKLLLDSNSTVSASVDLSWSNNYVLTSSLVSSNYGKLSGSQTWSGANTFSSAVTNNGNVVFNGSPGNFTLMYNSGFTIGDGATVDANRQIALADRGGANRFGRIYFSGYSMNIGSSASSSQPMCVWDATGGKLEEAAGWGGYWDWTADYPRKGSPSAPYNTWDKGVHIVSNSVAGAASALATSTTNNAYLWFDGTNLCVFLKTASGTTTNKVSVTTW